jgi:hypothetical protein
MTVRASTAGAMVVRARTAVGKVHNGENLQLVVECWALYQAQTGLLRALVKAEMAGMTVMAVCEVYKSVSLGPSTTLKEIDVRQASLE